MEITKAYELLGLAHGATSDEIKSAYRELLMVWHPDRFPANSSVLSKAVEQTKAINAAYECLKGYRPTEPPRESGPAAGATANQGHQQSPPPPPPCGKQPQKEQKNTKSEKFGCLLFIVGSIAAGIFRLWFRDAMNHGSIAPFVVIIVACVIWGIYSSNEKK